MIKFTEKEKKVISEAVADSNNRNKFCPRWRSFFRLDRLHGVPLWQEMIIFVGLIFCILVLCPDPPRDHIIYATLIFLIIYKVVIKKALKIKDDIIRKYEQEICALDSTSEKAQ